MLVMLVDSHLSYKHATPLGTSGCSSSCCCCCTFGSSSDKDIVSDNGGVGSRPAVLPTCKVSPDKVPDFCPFELEESPWVGQFHSVPLLRNMYTC